MPGGADLKAMALQLLNTEDNFVSVTTGRLHTCALTKLGNVFCTGKEGHPAVFNSDTKDNYAIEAGYDVTSRIDKDGI